MKMDYSRKHTEIDYLSNIRKDKINAKNSILKLVKDREIEANIIEDVRNIFQLKKQ